MTSINLNLELEDNEFGLRIMLVAFTAVEVMLGKIGTSSQVFVSSFNCLRLHWYFEPLHGAFGHSEVTRNLLEAETIVPQSIKHLKTRIKQKFMTNDSNLIPRLKTGVRFFFCRKKPCTHTLKYYELHSFNFLK